MITTYTPSRTSTIATRLLGGVAVVFASLMAVALAVRLDALAAGIALFAAVAAITVWRPRYGFYTALLLAILLEPYADDPIMYVGWMLQSNVSSWSPLGFVNFSPIEILLLITALAVLAGAVVERRWPRMPELHQPLLIFLGLLVASVGWGVMRHGSLNIALWETRNLFLAGVVALLVPNVLPRRGQVIHLVNLLCVAVVLLSIEIIWRRFTLLGDRQSGQFDLAFAHETPILMNVVIVLLLARLVWPASRWQRLAALTVPLIIFAEMVTERRAGWIGLDVGLVLVVIFIFRLRRKAFFFIVVPLLLLYAGYLAAFWNAEGAIAQPARAVRSINDPEGRDVYSNLYRYVERSNVRENIRAYPVTGLGFGQPYVFYYQLIDLSSFWPFYRYESHVAVLWLWMEMGAAGFIAFLVLCAAGVVRGVQLLKRETNNRSAPILVALVSALLMLLVYSYVDLGLTDLRASLLLGLVLGVIGTWGRDAALREVR